MFHLTGRYVIIDGLRHNIRRTDQYGLWVNNCRLIEFPDADSPIEAGLTYADGQTHIGCLNRDGNKDYHDDNA
jgi:hypothetical protein